MEEGNVTDFLSTVRLFSNPKCIKLLLELCYSSDGLFLYEVAKSIDAFPQEVYRILRRLTSIGLVSKHPSSKRYVLTLKGCLILGHMLEIKETLNKSQPLDNLIPPDSPLRTYLKEKDMLNLEWHVIHGMYTIASHVKSIFSAGKFSLLIQQPMKTFIKHENTPNGFIDARILLTFNDPEYISFLHSLGNVKVKVLPSDPKIELILSNREAMIFFADILGKINHEYAIYVEDKTGSNLLAVINRIFNHLWQNAKYAF